MILAASWYESVPWKDVASVVTVIGLIIAALKLAATFGGILARLKVVEAAQVQLPESIKSEVDHRFEEARERAKELDAAAAKTAQAFEDAEQSQQEQLRRSVAGMSRKMYVLDRQHMAVMARCEQKHGPFSTVVEMKQEEQEDSGDTEGIPLDFERGARR